MNGGGPVLANAWTMFPAITTRKTPIASLSSGRRTRCPAEMSLCFIAMSSTPIVTTHTQKMKRAHV